MNRRIVSSAALLIATAMFFTACNNTPSESTSDTNLDSTTTTIESSEESSEETTNIDTTESTSSEETTPTGFDVNSVSSIDITSENLTDGVWDSIISNTLNGENLSPELSWTEVEGAYGYIVYMIDIDANWLHMEVFTTETSLAAGSIDGSDDNQYIGPYPPSGTHNYVIYVVALRDEPSDVSTHFDRGNNTIGAFLETLYTSASGEPDNILAYGSLEGTYTSGT